MASRAPSGPRRTHAQARVQHRGQRPGPWRPASRQRAPVPAGLWPHQRVVSASLMAQRTGNRPPADDREDSSGGVSGGGGLCPCPSRPCPSRLPLEVSVLVSHFARHCPSLRGSRGSRLDPALDGHLPSLSSRVLPDAELQAQAFSVSAHQRLLGFLWIPPHPPPRERPRSLCLGVNAQKTPPKWTDRCLELWVSGSPDSGHLSCPCHSLALPSAPITLKHKSNHRPPVPATL